MNDEAVVILGGSGRLGRACRALLSARAARRVVNVDPRDPTPFPDDLQRFALVVLAAKITGEAAGEGLTAIEALFETNVLVPLRFSAAHTPQVTRIIFASSLEVYGDVTDALPLREEAALRPTSAYGISKLLGERALSLHCRDRGIPYVGLRFGSLYGAEDDLGNALASFLRLATRGEAIELHGDGSGTRSYMHLDDAAGAVVAALDYPGGDVFNAAHPAPVTLLELAQTAIAVAGSGQIVFTHPHSAAVHRALDASKLRLLPYVPRVDVAAGMRRCVDLLRRQS